MSKRLFVGLELPKTARKLLAELDPGVKGVRWLPEHQLHLTLSFLGEVESEPEERLREGLSAIDVPSFFLPIEGVGCFGGARPSVVWAGVGKGHPYLFALYKHIQDAALQAGLSPDLRSFHPHITLARAKNISRASILPFLRRHAETEFDVWKVSDFALFSSQLSREGSIYRVEMRRELRPN